MEKIMPGCFSRNGGMYGSSKASSSIHRPSTLSASLNRPGLRLAPTGSFRNRTFSLVTSWAMGIWDRSRSGKLARMARPLVTTPETPKPMSSARS
jgi:hypothetical protein